MAKVYDTRFADDPEPFSSLVFEKKELGLRGYLVHGVTQIHRTRVFMASVRTEGSMKNGDFWSHRNEAFVELTTLFSEKEKHLLEMIARIQQEIEI